MSEFINLLSTNLLFSSILLIAFSRLIYILLFNSLKDLYEAIYGEEDE